MTRVKHSATRQRTGDGRLSSNKRQRKMGVGGWRGSRFPLTFARRGGGACRRARPVGHTATPAVNPVAAPRYAVPSVSQFYNDLNTLLAFSADGPAKSFCFRRLTFLDSKFTCVVFACLLSAPTRHAGLCAHPAGFFGGQRVRRGDGRLHIQLNEVEEKASCKVPPLRSAHRTRPPVHSPLTAHDALLAMDGVTASASP